MSKLGLVPLARCTLGTLALALAPELAIAAACDLAASDRDYRITGLQPSGVFIQPGQTVLISNANIQGDVQLWTVPWAVTHVSVVNSQISGGIKAVPVAGDGDGSICVRGSSPGSLVGGAIAVERSRKNSKIRIYNNVVVNGEVDLEKTDLVGSGAACGGNLIITGDGSYRPSLGGGGEAGGSCKVVVTQATLGSDFEADGVTGDVTITDVTIDGDFQVQGSLGDVLIEDLAASGVSVDGARNVEWRSDRGINGGGDFSNILQTLTIDDLGSVFPVNGGISGASIDVATITNSRVKSGVEFDQVRQLIIMDNVFPEGAISVQGELVDFLYTSERADIRRNQVGGGLGVSEVRNVVVRKNTVANGNLTILTSQSCDVSENNVLNGNVETFGCAGTDAGSQCTAALADPTEFPLGLLATGKFYWCSEGEVNGLLGEIEEFDPGFETRPLARAAAEFGMEIPEIGDPPLVYSTAIWSNLGTWREERDHAVETPGPGDGEGVGSQCAAALLDPTEFPLGMLTPGQFYWCSGAEVNGLVGEIEEPDPGFTTRPHARTAAEADLSLGEVYSTAIWTQQGTWREERDHVVETVQPD